MGKEYRMTATDSTEPETFRQSRRRTGCLRKIGGLRRIDDLDKTEPCRHPEHEPPSMIVLPSGKYEYTCPGCGHTVTFYVQGFNC